LIATEAMTSTLSVEITTCHDRMLVPIRTNSAGLAGVLESVLRLFVGRAIVATQWESGRYCPTPTIIEAATALYNGHSVAEISRSEASAINLTQPSHALAGGIRSAKAGAHKAICFVTGVPGAGKTLVGLNVATTHIDKN